MKNFFINALTTAVILILGSPVFSGTDSNVCVQSQLRELGYYSGKITGKIDGPTKTAGDQYIAYMQANNPGWAQPRLTSSEAAFWCKQLASAFPDKLSKYLAASQGKGTGLVRVTGMSISGQPNTTQPYQVTVEFASEGSSPSTVNAACFKWNGKSEVCLSMPDGTSKGPVTAGLTTGRAGKYTLNVYLKYESGGKKLKSAESSIELVVE